MSFQDVEKDIVRIVDSYDVEYFLDNQKDSEPLILDVEIIKI